MVRLIRALWVLLILTAVMILGATPVFAETDHCPDHSSSTVTKDESGEDDNSFVPEAGLLICVKAGSSESNETGTSNTGIIETDGSTTLQGYLKAAGIVGGDLEGRNVSYWVLYGPAPTPIPTPTPVVTPTPVPTQNVSAPTPTPAAAQGVAAPLPNTATDLDSQERSIAIPFLIAVAVGVLFFYLWMRVGAARRR